MEKIFSSDVSGHVPATFAECVPTEARLRVSEGREFLPALVTDFADALNDTHGVLRAVDAGATAECAPALRRQSFELSSFAIPARWQSVRGETDRAALEQEFQNEIAVALVPFVEQLPIGAALVVEYELSPAGGGALRLQVRFRVEAAEARRDSHALDRELRTCLSALSDHYAFRAGDALAPSFRDDDARTWIVRPLVVDVYPRLAIGFTSRQTEESTGFRFPAMDVSRAGSGRERNSCWAHWSAALRHAFKAARGAGDVFRVRVRLTRERLSESAKSSLRRLRLDDLECVASVSEATPDGRLAAPPFSPAMLGALVAGWNSVAADALRVELEAEVSDGRTNNSLLRILAAEVFPGLPVEIVPAAPAGRKLGASPLLDLSNLYPLAAGLPPVLPHPSLLDALDYPRHYSNPSLALPADGLVLGIAPMNGFEHPVRIAESDRSRHIYVLGTTGSGKSTLLYSMIRQDMEAGRGCALLEPHGDLFEQCLEAVPEARIPDVIIIDPSDPDLPVGLNPLDFGDKPDVTQVSRLINDLLDIFDDLYDMRATGGPGFEMFFRNTLLLACTAPSNLSVPGLPVGAPTLLTAVEILRDFDLRSYLMAKCPSSFLGADLGGEVVRFFESAHKQHGEQSFSNWVPYVTCKLSRFLNNPRLRRLLCTPKRTVDFRKILDERKILLVNLNKGEIGDQDTRMIGMLLTKFLFQAALSRSDLPREERTPFYYYLDEFQNFVTSDVPDALAESRKYGLHLCLAHQTLSQLDEKGSRSMVSAVLGNCATKLIFRVGLEEASVLEPAFLPQFDAYTMCQLPDRKVLARILVNNRPTPPFVFETLPVRRRPKTGEGVDVSTAARAWSREAYSPERANAAEASSKSEQKSEPPELIESVAAETAIAAEVPAEPPQEYVQPTLLGGLVALERGAQCTSSGYIELKNDSDRAQQRWRSLANTGIGTDILPEVGKFYWTTNRSLVLIDALVDDHARGLVVVGGHGDPYRCGESRGELLNLSRRGNLLTSGPSVEPYASVELPHLLGMNLFALADLAFEDDRIFDTEIDGSGSWLFEPTPIPTMAAPGFYLTFNRSLVFVIDVSKIVIELPKIGAAWKAIVCRGGHGFRHAPGKESLNTYELTDLGQYEISCDDSQNVRPTDLGRIAGMSLARRLPMRGLDLPDDWPESLPAKAGKVRPSRRGKAKAG